MEQSQQRRLTQLETGESADVPAAGADAAADARIKQLERLGQLRDSGVLTADEFAQEKQKVLGG